MIPAAAVVGVTDPRWGEVGLAFIVVQEVAASDGEPVTETDIHAHLARRLARYKIPRSFEFTDTPAA